MSPGALVYGSLQRSGEALDEVILCRRANPDVFEVNCHGGVVPLMRVAAALRALGMAEALPESASLQLPLMGQVDAIRCEAMEALPHALTPVAVKMLLDQAAGAMSSVLEQLHTRLKQDDEAASVREDMLDLLRTATLGLRLCHPPRIVIAGKPNVGKSTLFNRLLKEERTLVDPTPGTTRDAIDHGLSIDGYPFVLVDTAGIATPADELGLMSTERSQREIQSADIVLVLMDRSQRFSNEDAKIIDSVPRERAIPVLNKGDLPSRLRDDESHIAHSFNDDPITISAQSGQGMKQLEAALVDRAFSPRWRKGTPAVFTERQKSLLDRAVGSINAALSAGSGERQTRLSDARCAIEECLYGVVANTRGGVT